MEIHKVIAYTKYTRKSCVHKYSPSCIGSIYNAREKMFTNPKRRVVLWVLVILITHGNFNICSIQCFLENCTLWSLLWFDQVYHTFHDEVAEYRQHWWRCDGPCQNRKPYFGFVKRAMNRPPGPRDPWFRDHQNSCNGTFIKVKEPENYGKKKKKEDVKLGKAIDKSGTNLEW